MLRLQSTYPRNSSWPICLSQVPDSIVSFLFHPQAEVRIRRHRLPQGVGSESDETSVFELLITEQLLCRVHTHSSLRE